MTPHELQALDFIRERITVAALAPSVREIAERVGVTVSGAHRIITSLAATGKLKRRPGQQRGLELVDAPDLRLASTDAITAELRRRGVAVIGDRRPALGRHAQSCAADTCGETVEVGHLMCRPHWFMLPVDLRRGLIRTNRDGETARFQALLTDAKDIADGLTPEMRQRRVG